MLHEKVKHANPRTCLLNPLHATASAAPLQQPPGTSFCRRCYIFCSLQEWLRKTTSIDRTRRSTNTSTSTGSETGTTGTRIEIAKGAAIENQARMQKDTLSSVEAAIEVTGIETTNVIDVTDTGIREMTERTGTRNSLVHLAGTALVLHMRLRNLQRQ